MVLLQYVQLAINHHQTTPVLDVLLVRLNPHLEIKTVQTVLKDFLQRRLELYTAFNVLVSTYHGKPFGLIYLIYLTFSMSS